MKISESPISDEALDRYFDGTNIAREPSLEKLHSRVQARRKRRTRTVSGVSLLVVVLVVAAIWIRPGTEPDSFVTTSPDQPAVSEPEITLGSVTSTEVPATTQEPLLTAAETYDLLVNSTWTIVELENFDDSSLFGNETVTFEETEIEGRLRMSLFDGCRGYGNLANILPDTLDLLSPDEGGLEVLVIPEGCLHDYNERLDSFGPKLAAFGATYSIDTSEDTVVSFTRGDRTVNAIRQTTPQPRSLTDAETYDLLVNSTWAIVELENFEDNSFVGTETLTFEETEIDGQLRVSLDNGCNRYDNVADVLPDTLNLLSADEGGADRVPLVQGCLVGTNVDLGDFGAAPAISAQGATISIDATEDPVVKFTGGNQTVRFTRGNQTVWAIRQPDEAPAEAPTTPREASLTADETYRLLVNSRWAILDLENFEDTSLVGTEELSFSETAIDGRLVVTLDNGCNRYDNVADVLADTLNLLSIDEGGADAVPFLQECLRRINVDLGDFGAIPEISAFGATISIDTSRDPIAKFTRGNRIVWAVRHPD